MPAYAGFTGAASRGTCSVCTCLGAVRLRVGMWVAAGSGQTARLDTDVLVLLFGFVRGSRKTPAPAAPRNNPPTPTMMLDEISSINSSNYSMTFNKVSASGRVSEVLACSCSTYAGRPPSWV